MIAEEVEKYFQYHNSNMRLIKIGFEEIKNIIKNNYLTKNKTGQYIYLLPNDNPERLYHIKIEKALSRVLSGVQVSWAEESLKRLLYEKELLTDCQRNYLLERPALDQRWRATLKIVFCIAYDLVPAENEICDSVRIERERSNLGDQLIDQYIELCSIITDYLLPSFEIRNKVQHGEWEFAFKPRYSAEFSQSITDKINNENIVTIMSRHTLINAYYQMIVDLGRFKSNNFSIDSMLTPFEYFYKSYMRKIKFESIKIHNSNLESYISQMVNKEMRGEMYRRATN